MDNAWLEITPNTKSGGAEVKNEFQTLYQYRIFYCGKFYFTKLLQTLLPW